MKGILATTAVSLALLIGCASSKPVTRRTPPVQPPPTVKNNEAPPKPTPSPAPTPTLSNVALVEPTQHKNNLARVWLDTLAGRNRRILYSRGYRIQAYSGPDREAAMKAKETLYRQLGDEQVYLTYSQPTFKVKVGNYMNRLEALLVQEKLRRTFPTALVVPEQVSIQE